ncbi:MAG: PadR family transcriptional regulator [Actinobacteria bacterium]|nr:PadR family transcriptional regulator [Actinomycetota bacterium]
MPEETGDRADVERVDRAAPREAVGCGRRATLPVKHAVLGLLMERAGYGYDVANRLSERLGPGVPVSEGTVHSSIKSLRNEGYIELVRRTFRGDQVAVWYSATRSGAGRYHGWLDEPLVLEPVRDELYLKFAMVDVGRLPRFRAEFKRLELECLAEIAVHTRGYPLADDLADPVSWGVARRLLLDSRALDHLNGNLAFIRRTLGVLRWAEEQGGTVPRDRLLEAVS